MITYEASITCDDPNCGATVAGSVERFRDMAHNSAIDAAVFRGWRYTEREQYCPRCRHLPHPPKQTPPCQPPESVQST